jgi:hypothetical protein
MTVSEEAHPQGRHLLPPWTPNAGQFQSCSMIGVFGVLVTIIYHGCMTRGGHGLPKVSSGAAFLCPAGRPPHKRLFQGRPVNWVGCLWHFSAPLDTPCCMPVSISNIPSPWHGSSPGTGQVFALVIKSSHAGVTSKMKPYASAFWPEETMVRILEILLYIILYYIIYYIIYIKDYNYIIYYIILYILLYIICSVKLK